MSQTEPTALELSNEVTRLQGVYDGNAYQRSRADQLTHPIAE